MPTSRRDFMKQLEAVAATTGLTGVVPAEPKERKSKKSVATTPADRAGEVTKNQTTLTRPRQLFAAEKVGWRGQWIWHGASLPGKNVYVYFRKTFQVGALPDEGRLHITADTEYKVWLNGRWVGEGPIFCDPRQQSYDSYDVKAALREGENVLAVLVYYYGEGMADEAWRVHRPRQRWKRVPHDSKPGLLCQLELGAGPTRSLVVSDQSWKSCGAECYATDVPKTCDTAYSERYYAEKEVGPWKDASYDDSAWSGVAAITGFHGLSGAGGAAGKGEQIPARVFPWTTLEPRDVPYLKKRDVVPKRVVNVAEVIDTELSSDIDVALQLTIDPLMKPEFTSVRTPESLLSNQQAEIIPFDHRTNYDDFNGIRSATIILDLGELLNGRIYLDLEGPAGAFIDVGYGQRLLPGGKPEMYSTRISSADRYITKAGRQQWTSFGWRHFRYAQLTFRGLRGPLKIHELKAVADDHPLEMAGSFRCSDEFLNWLWEAGVRTARVNIHRNIVCGINREARQGSFDACYNLPPTLVAFGDIAAVRNYLRNMLRSQTMYGFLMVTFGNTYEVGQLLAGGGEATLDVLWNYYAQFGNPEILAEAYVPVKRHLEFQDNFRDKDGLLYDHPMPVFQDNADISGEVKPKVLTLNVRYARGLQIAGWIAQKMDDEKMARRCLDQWKETVDCINAKFWDEARGAFVDYITLDDQRADHISEHGNYMMMTYGYVSPERAARIAQCLRDPGVEVGQVSPLQMNFLMDGLFNYGYADDALKEMTKRYGRMKKVGQNTLGETWNLYGARDWEKHGWLALMSRGAAVLASPAYTLPRWVLGIAPLDPGYRRLEITPPAASLKWAQGAVPSPFGQIPVSWKRDGNDFYLECELPAEVEGVIRLPYRVDGVQRLQVNGKDVSRPEADERGRVKLAATGRTQVRLWLR